MIHQTTRELGGPSYVLHLHSYSLAKLNNKKGMVTTERSPQLTVSERMEPATVPGPNALTTEEYGISLTWLEGEDEL